MRDSIYAYTVILFFVSQFVSAQNLQCIEMRDNIISSAPSLIQSSLQELDTQVQNWQKDCFENEELIRLSILRAIDLDLFDENSYDKNIIGFLYSFDTQSSEMNRFFYSPNFRKDDEATQSFDQATQWYAENLIDSKKAKSDLALALLRHYAKQQPIWEPLKANSLQEHKIQSFYNEIKTTKATFLNDVIGVELGSQVGYDRRRSFLFLNYAYTGDTFLFKTSQGFLSDNGKDYEIPFREGLKTVDSDFGYAFNVEIGYKILSTKKTDVFGGLISEGQFYQVNFTDNVNDALPEEKYSQFHTFLFFGPSINVVVDLESQLLGFRLSHLSTKSTRNNLSNGHLSASICYSIRLKSNKAKNSLKKIL